MVLEETIGRPSTTQLISDGGLLRSVLQCNVTVSPALASRGPAIVTLAGANCTVSRTDATIGVSVIWELATHL